MIEPGLRVGRIERHVGCAGLHHREESDHQIDRAVEPDADVPPRASAEILKPAGEVVRAGLELTVAQRPGSGDDGGGIRAESGAGLERGEQSVEQEGFLRLGGGGHAAGATGGLRWN